MNQDSTAAGPRRFYAYLLEEARDSCHVVPDATGFEEAALLYAERWAIAAGEATELSVIVIEPATGERRCFRLDLDTGEAGPCG